MGDDFDNYDFIKDINYKEDDDDDDNDNEYDDEYDRDNSYDDNNDGNDNDAIIKAEEKKLKKKRKLTG